MTKTRVAFYIILLISAMQFLGCKKETNPNIGFSTSQVSLDAVSNPKATVTVQLSKSVNQIIDVWFQLEGPDTLQFGSYNSNFINDDSARILGVLSVPTTIDTPFAPYLAHVTLNFGTSSFTIALNALFNNFPKMAKQYKIKIVQVSNANIQTSGNELTININSTPMTPVFTSTVTTTDPVLGTAVYTLNSVNFSPVGNGLWDFDLAYTETSSGPSPGNPLNINFSNMTPVLGNHTYTSDDTYTTLKTTFMLSPTPNSVYGNYYIMADSANAIKYQNGTTTGKGDLQCSFVLF